MRFVGNAQVYQAPRCCCFIAAHAIEDHEALFIFKIYLLWNFFEIIHVKS